MSGVTMENATLMVALLLTMGEQVSIGSMLAPWLDNKLVETSATLLVTSALLVVTRSY